MIRHLLVIGGQRCGSTYLRTLLEGHPGIAMAQPATPEPKVFLTDEATRRGLGWYHDTWFSHAEEGQLLADKSTSYLEDPLAAGRARQMLGEAHILAVLRDPVERAVSNWRFSVAHGLEERALAEALAANMVGTRPWDSERTSVSPFAYLERGCYAGHLDPWFAEFPGTTHVVFLRELHTDAEVLPGLLEELGVAPGHRPGHLPQRVNRSTGPEPDLAVTLLDDLRAWFAPHDLALEARLGRQVPWPVRREGGMS